MIEAKDILGTCSLEDPIDGYLCYLEDKKFIPQLRLARNLQVIVLPELLDDALWHEHSFYVSSNPRAEFARIHNEYYDKFQPFTTGAPYKDTIKGKLTSHLIAIGDRVSIGEGTIIHPNVTIYNDTTIGNNCTISAGTVIGAEGFSTLVDEYGQAQRIKNVGRVVIEDNVFIGANNCIDRATFGKTYVRNGVHTDNFVHIAHNCDIGPNTRIAPMTCFSGSCKVGRNVWVSVGCSIREHVTIGDEAFLCMGAVVTRDVPKGAKVAGHYAVDSKMWNRHCKFVAGDTLV